MFSLTVMYEVLNHYWKRGRMSLFASPGSTWNLQPVNLTLAFSRLVENSVDLSCSCFPASSRRSEGRGVH